MRSAISSVFYMSFLPLAALLLGLWRGVEQSLSAQDGGPATSSIAPSPSGPSTSIRCSPIARTKSEFNSQIYEPPLQYHYLKRPTTLVPLTTEAVPRPRYVDAAGKTVAGGCADWPSQKVYEIRIRSQASAISRIRPSPAT
jgi:hypothetical protein